MGKQCTAVVIAQLCERITIRQADEAGLKNAIVSSAGEVITKVDVASRSRQMPREITLPDGNRTSSNCGRLLLESCARKNAIADRV